MSLKILFADDSVTAQNMGKKILTEAGYEVVAVSNGAAAVKKIAEQKPDIIILDVYMPGYSGLEVCEKVRSSLATIKTPVLLTVGKMEPYKAEDANRVRADGVIIKPFEASDLLAIMKKFEERIAATTAAVAPPPPPPRPPVKEIFVPAAESNHEPPARSIQPMVEVPDHMATSSAFSELLGTDASHMGNFHVPPAAAAPAMESKASAVASPEYGIPASWRIEPEPQPAVVQAAPAEASVADIAVSETQPPEVSEAELVQPAEAELPRVVQIPVYQDPEAESYEVVPTAAAPTGSLDVAREPGLQESAEETTRNTVADRRDPDLVPTAHHIPAPVQAAASVIAKQENPFSAHEEFGVIREISHAADATAAAEAAPAVPSMPLSEADFEARVAAAMAAYGQSAESRGPVASEPVPTEIHDIETAPVEIEQSQTVTESAPAYEHHPVVGVPEPQNEHLSETVSLGAEDHAVPASEATMPQVAEAAATHEAVEPMVEAELPAAVHAVAQATGAAEQEHDNIAQAVHRVMERMKVNLVEEIVRELKSKK